MGISINSQEYSQKLLDTYKSAFSIKKVLNNGSFSAMEKILNTHKHIVSLLNESIDEKSISSLKMKLKEMDLYVAEICRLKLEIENREKNELLSHLEALRINIIALQRIIDEKQ